MNNDNIFLLPFKSKGIFVHKKYTIKHKKNYSSYIANLVEQMYSALDLNAEETLANNK